MAVTILEGVGWAEPSQCLPNARGLDLLLAQGRHQNQTATSRGSRPVSAVVSLLLPFKEHLVLFLHLSESWGDSGMEERGLNAPIAPLPVNSQ